MVCNWLVLSELLFFVAACSKSGNWFPDPICRALPTSNYTPKIVLCSSFDIFNAIGPAEWSQSAIAAVLTSVAFVIFACFITGFVCGCLCHKNKQTFKIFWTTRQTKSYEGQQFHSKVSVSQNLEMTENVA